MLLRDDKAVLEEWREATTRLSQRPVKSHDNIMPFARQGTSLSYTLSRLKRKKPDLFMRVVNGELSANAAAIEAGWRKKLSALGW
ncbi:MAG: hypothetical protein WBW03_00805, partial [Silvibacterium sp.]